MDDQMVVIAQVLKGFDIRHGDQVISYLPGRLVRTQDLQKAKALERGGYLRITPTFTLDETGINPVSFRVY